MHTSRTALRGLRSRSMSSTSALELQLLRLPTVVFPSQAVTFGVSRPSEPLTASSDFTVSDGAMHTAWKAYDGRLAAFGPSGARVGVELRVIYDDVLGSVVETPPNVAHAVGVRRLRLLRTKTDQPDGEPPVGVFETLEDRALSEQKEERLEGEADAARQLLEHGLDAGRFALESCVFDEELGPPACDPQSHPLHELELTPPTEAGALSLWLGARLPLTTGLRGTLLSCCCPLKRMQHVVDTMRLLNEPHRLRFGHRFRLIATTPATDNCSMASTQEGPRYVVGEALPQYTAWSDTNSFPHG